MSNEKLKKEIGKRVANIRRKVGWNQNQTANFLGHSIILQEEIENGEGEIPLRHLCSLVAPMIVLDQLGCDCRKNKPLKEEIIKKEETRIDGD
mgnify:CR=1 FL=1